jgi:hypothetical protein
VNPALVAAWLAGEGIVTWRIVHRDHRLPAPGELIGITALFLAGALVADIYPKAAGLVVVTLAGLDVAAFLNVLPQGLGGQITEAEAAQTTGAGGATGTTQAPGTTTAGGRG